MPSRIKLSNWNCYAQNSSSDSGNLFVDSDSGRLKKRSLTRHAKRRARQRLGWNGSALKNQFTKATMYGWYYKESNSYVYKGVRYCVIITHNKITLLTVYLISDTHKKLNDDL